MGETRWLEPDEQRSWRLLVIATLGLLETLDVELAASSDLSMADYEVLVHLSEADDQRLRMSELAQLVRLSPSGLTRRIDRMSRSGLVRREQCEEDRRGSFAVLTAMGREQLELAAPAHVEQVRHHFAGLLDQEEHRLLGDLLERIALGCGLEATWPPRPVVDVS